METNNAYLIGLIKQLKSHEPQHCYLLQGKDNKVVKGIYMNVYAYLIETIG
jgi:hypothetical protein